MFVELYSTLFLTAVIVGRAGLGRPGLASGIFSQYDVVVYMCGIYVC